MTVWQRILRYLILWLVLFAILCLISVIRYWDELVAIAANAFDSYFSLLLSFGLVIGLLIWAFRLMFRGFT